MTPNTVFDRAKLTGFMSGPKHAMPEVSGANRMMPADAGGMEQKAPNYRESDAPDQDCMDCANLDKDTQDCKMHGFKPKLYYVCDDFKGEDSENEQQAPANPSDTNEGQ